MSILHFLTHHVWLSLRQTIVFLAYLCHVNPGQTHLIIVPASVLSNWETEFARFAPQVKVLRYHGSTAERGAIRDDHQYVHPLSL